MKKPLELQNFVTFDIIFDIFSFFHYCGLFLFKFFHFKIGATHWYTYTDGMAKLMSTTTRERKQRATATAITTVKQKHKQMKKCGYTYKWKWKKKRIQQSNNKRVTTLATIYKNTSHTMQKCWSTLTLRIFMLDLKDTV